MSSPEGERARAGPSPGQIFSAFFRIGLTAFGGPAMVSHIRELVVAKRGWLSPELFQEGIALCQALPGAIAVNVAAYAGYRCGGIPGLLAAFFGFGLPAFGLMLLLSVLYRATRALPSVEAIFSGLAVVVVAIVLHATLVFGRNSLRSVADFGLALLAALLLLLRVSPFLVILTGGLLGIVFFRLRASELCWEERRHRRGSYRDAALLLVVFLAFLLLLWPLAPTLFALAWVMAKIELFAFGGGYTAVSLLFHEVVTVRGWLVNQTLLDGVALGQLTPGPILNTATFIGYLVSGLPGAIVATLGIFWPGLVLVAGVLPIFDRIRGSVLFPRIIRGIVACFVGLLLFVAVKFALAIGWEGKRLLLLLASFCALFLKVELLWVVAGAGLASYLFF